MTLIIVMAISAVLNILLVWYIINLLQRLMFVSENIGALVDSVNIFGDHAKNIYELDVFYGDETLQGLINHLKQLHEDIEEFEQIYSLTEQEEVEEEEFYDDETNETEESQKT